MWSDIKNEIIDNKIFLPDFLKKHFKAERIFLPLILSKVVTEMLVYWEKKIEKS